MVYVNGKQSLVQTRTEIRRVGDLGRDLGEIQCTAVLHVGHLPPGPCGLKGAKCAVCPPCYLQSALGAGNARQHRGRELERPL